MKRPMLIFVIESTSGGSKRHVVDALQAFSRRSFDCVLIYSLGRHDDLFLMELQNLQALNVRCIELPMTRGFSIHNFRAMRRLRNIIREIAADGQAVLLHGHSSIGGMVARGAKYLLRRHPGILVVLYSPHSPITMNPQLGFMKRLVYRSAEYAMGLLTDRIIAVSQDEWAHLTTWPRCRSKLSLVHNGIQAMKETTVNNIGSHTKRQSKILFVGRLSEQKHPLYALEIMKRLPGYKLTVVGDGEYFSRMQEKITKEKLNNQIRMVGYKRQVDTYYQEHQAVILSSRYEGFPYVVLEAMANGCVVIGTDVPGLRGVLKETGNICIPLDHPDQAASHIKEQLEDTEAMERLRISNRKVVQETYTIQRMSDELEEIYRSLLQVKEYAATC